MALRQWQQQAIQAFNDSTNPSFLTVACPGAGKTVFALVCARSFFAGKHRPFVVVVPTQHLKVQWAESALKFGFHLDPFWNTSQGPPPRDVHGVIVTYSQAASSWREIAKFSKDGFVILDEIHHAASDKSWGTGVYNAFSSVKRRLLLSGTPFRSDDSPIPFVNYSFGDYGEAQADFEYGYREALTDGGVVRPVYFPRFDGLMEWVSATGDVQEATFNDELASSEWGARLRTALSVEGEWIRVVIDKAHQKLTEIRETHTNAGGLIIATDQEHARSIVELLKRRHGIKASIAVSEDANASSVIEGFAKSNDPWIVAVRMISEGVDIPRLRVAVFATTTTTAMFFRQAVGRIARWTRGMREQNAYMYLPDDIRLREHAANLATQRRHSIELRKGSQSDEEIVLDEPLPDRPAVQLSLFAALSSTAIEGEQTSGPATNEGIDPDERFIASAKDLIGYPIDVPLAPPLPGRDNVFIDPFQTAEKTPLVNRASEKAQLKESNFVRVRELAARTDYSYPQINRMLNKESGITSIHQASTAELATRLEIADRWIKSLK